MKIKTHVNPNYKTKKCIQFHEKGYCPYGSRCQFMHKEPNDTTVRERFMSMQIPIDVKPKISESSYAGIIREIACRLNSETDDLSSNPPVKKRLKTFENLVSEEPESWNSNASGSLTLSKDNSRDFKELQDEIFKYTFNDESDGLAAYDIDKTNEGPDCVLPEEVWIQLKRSRFFSA